MTEGAGVCVKMLLGAHPRLSIWLKSHGAGVLASSRCAQALLPMGQVVSSSQGDISWVSRSPGADSLHS